ncbi:MAG: type I-F CRISPR-associated protein Csy1 [Candidatus Competibacter sp.]|nr:type I-F CRISPR-associated protein Csy1 [Candidatus Competibacter sp.]MDG4585608.1 type I-F CRISPR-associated protein Csy1 [Candidatus Competibacter sp.]
MTGISNERRAAFRNAIETFLTDRLNGKLDKLQPDDPKRDELIAQFAREAWLAEAAKRVAWIQVVTHTLKPIHPDARGTNLFCVPSELKPRDEVGSHALGDAFSSDVVGNAAALDVYKLLKLEVSGRSLLDWLQECDLDLLAALSDDAEQAQNWADAFRGITTPRSAKPGSHTLAKQIYWLADEDPADDTAYHLLAPLYSSTLAHTVFQTINEDRFGEAGKLARQARREHRDHETGYHEYPSLAVQKFGGTKPQNISQLNSERGGNNYLLASSPPNWKTQPVKAPLFVDSVFPFFGRIAEVRQTAKILRDFLLSDPPPNKDTRDRRTALIDRLIDELVDFAHSRQATLSAGWTRNLNCRLADDEKLWLDPRRAESEDAADAEFCSHWQWMDWPMGIGRRFGNWLNHALGQTLPLGDIEGRQWRDELLLHTEWAGVLHHQRVAAEAPTYIATRGAKQ